MRLTRILECSDFILLIRFLLYHLFINHRETEKRVLLIVDMNSHVKSTTKTITANTNQASSICQALFCFTHLSTTLSVLLILRTQGS